MKTSGLILGAAVMCCALGLVLLNAVTSQFAPVHHTELAPQTSSSPQLSSTTDAVVDLGYGYTKNSSHVYAYGVPVPEADPATFRFIRITRTKSGGAEDYASDATHVFLNDEIIPDADPATFKIVNLYAEIARDSHAVFVGSAKVAGADPQSFQLLLSPNANTFPDGYWNPDLVYAWGRDDTSVFLFILRDDAPNPTFAAKQIVGADPTTFTPLGEGEVPYSKDKSRCYFMEAPISGADPDSFVLVSPESGVARDRNFEYRRGVQQLPATSI